MTTRIETALRKVYGWYGLDRLQTLHDAFVQDRVVRKVYVDLAGKRCIMSHLDNDITSRLKLQEKYPNPMEYLTTRVVIENWDAGLLTKDKAQEILAEVIAERIEQEAATRRNAMIASTTNYEHADELVCAI